MQLLLCVYSRESRREEVAGCEWAWAAFCATRNAVSAAITAIQNGYDLINLIKFLFNP